MATLKLNSDTRRFLAFSKTYLRWIDGPLAGQPMDWTNEPFIVFHTNNILSRNPDTGLRNFTTAYFGLAKGNLKSSWGAALALFFLVCESAMPGNRGMQIYAIAASKDQARVVFGYAKRMAEESPLLRDLLTIHRDMLMVPETKATFKVTSSDAPKRHGWRPAVVICDELHAHENGDMYENAEASMVTAREPLMVILTNAGSNEESDHICAQLYRRGKAGSDPRMYFYSPTIEDDEVDDPQTWKRVNPASFITLERLMDQRAKMPTFRFERWHLNRWTRADESWLRRGLWEDCGQVGDILVPGEDVIIGLDLSKRHDSTALVIVAPRDGKYYSQCEVWATWPDPDREPPRAHHIIEGDEIPIRQVFDRVAALRGQYNVLEVVAGEYRMTDWLWEELIDDGYPMVRFSQGNKIMAPACQGLYDAITNQEVVHADDPIFTAQIQAATVRDLGDMGWILDKNKAKSHMDASIALAIAVERAREYMGAAERDFTIQWIA